MKTPFPQRNKRSPFQKKALYVLGVFLVGAVLFSLLDGVFVGLAAPIWKGESALALNFWHFTGFFKDKNTLLRENEALREKARADEFLLAASRASESQYESLLQVFGRTSTTTSVAAGVLVHPPETPYDVLVVDAGSTNGVKKEDLVFLPEGAVVGRVIEVFGRSSRVKLFSMNGENTNAVLERGNVPIVLVGQGGGNFKFTLPREVAVLPGDRILSPAVDGALMGVARDVEVTPTDSFKTVLVESRAPVFTIRYVTIHI